MIFICDFEYKVLVLHYEIIGVKQAHFVTFFKLAFVKKVKQQ
jgi:hypothetical protein